MRPRDDRPDLLRMTYEEYVARFNHLKELQNGGSGDKPGGDKPGGADGGLAAEGKENSGGAPLAIEAPPEKAASGGGGEAGAPVDGGAAPPDLAAMGEEEYVEYCKRYICCSSVPPSCTACCPTLTPGFLQPPPASCSQTTLAWAPGAAPCFIPPLLPRPDCVRRASAQAGLPFDAELARQHYRAARGGGGAAAAPS